MERIARILALAAAVAASSCATDAAPAEAAAPQPSGQAARTKVISAVGAVPNTGWAVDWSGYSGTSHGCVCSYSAGRFAVPLPLEEGDRMLSMTVAATGVLTATLDVYAMNLAAGGAATVDVITPLGSIMSAWRDYTIDLVDTTVSGGTSYWFEFAASKAGLCVGAVRLTYDRPSG